MNVVSIDGDDNIEVNDRYDDGDKMNHSETP